MHYSPFVSGAVTWECTSKNANDSTSVFWIYSAHTNNVTLENPVEIVKICDVIDTIKVLLCLISCRTLHKYLLDLGRAIIFGITCHNDYWKIWHKIWVPYQFVIWKRFHLAQMAPELGLEIAEIALEEAQNFGAIWARWISFKWLEIARALRLLQKSLWQVIPKIFAQLTTRYSHTFTVKVRLGRH